MVHLVLAHSAVALLVGCAPSAGPSRHGYVHMCKARMSEVAKTTVTPPPVGEQAGAVVPPASGPLGWADGTGHVPVPSPWVQHRIGTPAEQDADGRQQFQQRSQSAASAAAQAFKDKAAAAQADSQAAYPLAWADGRAHIPVPTPWTGMRKGDEYDAEGWNRSPNRVRPNAVRPAASPSASIAPSPVAAAPPPATAVAADVSVSAPPAASLESRVAKARAVCDSAIDKRARELVQVAIDEYFADKIDEEELKRRKNAATETATTEHAELGRLEKAYDEYAVATVASVAAEKALAEAQRALAEAVKTEGEAAQMLDGALRSIGS